MTAQIRISGVLKGNSSVAYAFDLPKSPCPETGAYLRELSQNYLAFLRKETKKARDGVFFGGLRVEEKEGALLLSSAFCPFDQRAYLPRAKITLDPEGRIESILKEKRSRRVS